MAAGRVGEVDDVAAQRRRRRAPSTIASATAVTSSAVDDRLELLDREVAALRLEDRDLGGAVRVAHLDAHEEAVELGLGQGIGALELDRVLRRDHHERRAERVGDAVDRHLALLHRLEQRGLGLRRRAVDLVGEDDVGEHAAGPELELAASSRFQTDTPVTSDGRRSGVNWTRCQVPPIERAIALASEVLPTPGTSSMRRWPEASRQTSARWTASRLPWMTCSTLSTSARKSGSTARRRGRPRGGDPAGSGRLGSGCATRTPSPDDPGCRRTRRECTGSTPDVRPAGPRGPSGRRGRIVAGARSPRGATTGRRPVLGARRAAHCARRAAAVADRASARPGALRPTGWWRRRAVPAACPDPELRAVPARDPVRRAGRARTPTTSSCTCAGAATASRPAVVPPGRAGAPCGTA